MNFTIVLFMSASPGTRPQKSTDAAVVVGLIKINVRVSIYYDHHWDSFTSL